MENRFGLEDLSECVECGAECEERYCPDCSEERYEERERQEELNELPF